MVTYVTACEFIGVRYQLSLVSNANKGKVLQIGQHSLSCLGDDLLRLSCQEVDRRTRSFFNSSVMNYLEIGRLNLDHIVCTEAGLRRQHIGVRAQI